MALAYYWRNRWAAYREEAEGQGSEVQGVTSRISCSRLGAARCRSTAEERSHREGRRPETGRLVRSAGSAANWSRKRRRSSRAADPLRLLVGWTTIVIIVTITLIITVIISVIIIIITRNRMCGDDKRYFHVVIRNILTQFTYFLQFYVSTTFEGVDSGSKNNISLFMGKSRSHRSQPYSSPTRPPKSLWCL